MPKANQVTRRSNRRAFLKKAPAVAAAAAIAAASGIPGNSLVEIDCIVYI